MVVFEINPKKLAKIANEIEDKFRVYRFHEPDINNELTAFATERVSGEDREHFKRFNLLR